jgi:hypothetical protein
LQVEEEEGGQDLDDAFGACGAVCHHWCAHPRPTDIPLVWMDDGWPCPTPVTLGPSPLSHCGGSLRYAGLPTVVQPPSPRPHLLSVAAQAALARPQSPRARFGRTTSLSPRNVVSPRVASPKLGLLQPVRTLSPRAQALGPRGACWCSSWRGCVCVTGG